LKIIFNIIKRENIQNFLFVFLLVIIYIFYNYQEILFLRPQGIHFIRQTDSLSFVRGYYKYGMNFFEPKALNLLSEEGKAVSEFPILYYVTACLYFIFGEKEFILRLINISIVSIGFYYLFILMRNFLKDGFYSFVFTFLFLSSTILIYYTNNFLPDPSAFGFTLIAWYFFYKYFSNGSNKDIVLSFLFFTISSLLKVTFLINPIAAFLTILFFNLYFKKISNIKFPLLLFGLSFTANLLWILFVVYYNNRNGSNYFTTNIRPLWSLSKQSIIEVNNFISNYWYTKYYFESTIHLMLVIVIGGVVFIKRINKEILIPAILLIIGSIIYIIMFYEMFKDHDYYFITILPTIIFIILGSFQGIKNKYPKVINNIIVKLIVLTICILSINYSKKKITQRYCDNIDEISIIGEKLDGFDGYLCELNVDNFSKIIVVKDLSRNGSLYFLNRQGWILKEFSLLNKNLIKKYTNLGAEYIIITDKTKIGEPFNLGEKIGEKNGATIFKLKKHYKSGV
jgi:hypothetical protein